MLVSVYMVIMIISQLLHSDVGVPTCVIWRHHLHLVAHLPWYRNTDYPWNLSALLYRSLLTLSSGGCFALRLTSQLVARARVTFGSSTYELNVTLLVFRSILDLMATLKQSL